MGYLIKQSTTAYELLFLMVDSADHFSPKTGLSPTVTIRKASGSFASPSGAVSEIANGWYKVAGNATDSATLGPLLLHATASGADPVDDRYEVVAFDPQDATGLGLSRLDAAITTRLAPTTSGRTLDVTAGGEAGIDWANIGSPTATVALSGTTVATTQKVDVETIKTNPVVNGGTVTFPTGATLASTTNITSASGVAVTSLAANSVTASALANDAVSEIANGMTTSVGWLALVQDVGAVQDTAGSIVDRLGAFSASGVNTVLGFFQALFRKNATLPSDIGGTFDPTTDSVEAIRERADAIAPLDAAGVRTAVGLASANLDTQLVTIDTVVDSVLARTDVATSTRLASSGNAGTGGVLLGDEEDVYPADIQCTIDDTNDRDEYTVQWFRNGAPVVSGITVPLIQVVKRADGTDLIASTAMTQVGSTGAYKYDAATEAERNTAGEAVLVQVSATINGSTRTWRKLITRDSAGS